MLIFCPGKSFVFTDVQYDTTAWFSELHLLSQVKCGTYLIIPRLMSVWDSVKHKSGFIVSQPSGFDL